MQGSLTNSVKICSKNGRSTMYSAYKQLKPGDLVLYGVGTTGHVRMVSAVGSGYVKCIEQSGLVPANKTSWKVDKTYTYAQLYSSNYIPVTMKNW